MDKSNIGLDEDTRELMTSIVLAFQGSSDNVDTKLVRACIDKMLKGQAEHGPGTWRKVDLKRFAQEECIDLINYTGMLRLRGDISPAMASSISLDAVRCYELLSSDIEKKHD